MADRPMTRARRPAEQAAFLATITESPSDDTARLEYADWLDEHGDPDRAAFIRAQIELRRLPAVDPQAPTLAASAARLLKRRKWEWLADLGVKIEDAGFERGFPRVVWMTAGGFLQYGRRLFEAAPVTGAVLTDLGDRAGRLAASPLLARLTSLRLSDETNETLRGRDVTPLFESPHAAGLRRLALGTGVQGDFPALAASDRLAGLRVLDLSWAFADLDCLGDGAAAPGLGSLVALNLGGNGHGDAAVRVLAGCPHLLRLRQLGLADNEVTTEGALVLARPDIFPRLRYLDVSGNTIGNRGLRALARRERLKTLLVGWNRPAGDTVIEAVERKGGAPEWDWAG